jgi:hypothetical protein
MSGKFEGRPDRRAGPLLASSLVMLLGALGIAILAAAGGKDPYIGLFVFLGALGGVLVFGYLVQHLPTGTMSTRFDWMKSKDARPANDYAPQPRRPRRQHYGERQPPSVEDIRDLKEGLNNWVPSNAPRRKKTSPEDQESR